jgi:probable HAF family extracellular repeat protein
MEGPLMRFAISTLVAVASHAVAGLPPVAELKLVQPPTFTGNGETSVTDINARGLAVGRTDYSYTDANGNIHTVTGTYDWRYNASPLEVTNGGLWTNDAGDRVTAGSEQYGSVFIPGGGGPETPIPPLPGHTFVIANEISETGMVVGTSGIFRIGIISAVAWTPQAGTVDLSATVPLARTANYASPSGLIVGHRAASDGSPLYGFILNFHTGAWTDLYRYFNPDAPTGVGRTIVRAVNDAGQVVGETTVGTALRAFVWSDADGPTYIPNPYGGGDDRVYANHINSAGIVVGEALSTQGGWRAYAWSADSGFLDLQGMVAGTGRVLSYANRINDRGEVCGVCAPVNSPWAAYTGYILAVPPCETDLNADGTLDFFDITAFLAAFSSGDLSADFVLDGELNFFDVSMYLAAFSAGCP